MGVARALWTLRLELIDSVHFDADLPQALVRVLLDQIFFELEVAEDETRALCAAFCAKLCDESRFARFWPPRFYNMVVECAKSPGVNHALAACPTRFLGSLFKSMERAAVHLLDSGTAGVKDLIGRTPDHLVGFLRHGPVAYRVVSMVLFPATSTKVGAAMLQSEVSKALTAACARSPDVVQAYFSHALEAALAASIANKRSVAEAWELVAFFQQLLGGSADTVVAHPHTAALVLATRGLQGVPLRKPWLLQLVKASKIASAFSAHVMRTLSAVLAVDQSLCLQLVGDGVLLRGVGSDPRDMEAVTNLACALIEAFAQIRALPDLMAALCADGAAGRTGLVRNILGHPDVELVRHAFRDALRNCLPSLASSLALIPSDEVSAQLVCDILRWGPIGPEAVSAGWNPSAWAAGLCRYVGAALAQGLTVSHRVHCALLGAIHYRWSPIQAAAVLPRQPCGDFFCLVPAGPLSGQAHPDFQRYCWLRLRLSRDFPQYWLSDAAEAQRLSLWLLEQGQLGLVDWAVLLWAGGLIAFQMWLRVAEESDGGFSAGAQDAAWRPDPARAFAAAEALLQVPLARACRLAAFLPLDFIGLCGLNADHAAVAVRALARVGRGAMLAALVAGHSPVWKRVASELWLREKLLLGPEVASALGAEMQLQIWGDVLSLPRPDVWPYAAMAAASGDEQVAAAARLLAAAGPSAWRDEWGCWSAWSAVLSCVQDWRVWLAHIGPVASSVFSVAWQSSQWSVLEALHGALHRLGCDGWLCAARLTLRLLGSGRVPQDASSSLLAAAVGVHYAVALEAALADRSCLTMRALLETPPSFHNVPLLREAMPRLLSLVQECSASQEREGPALASRCVERTIR
jgi:hypothetical protein